MSSINQSPLSYSVLAISVTVLAGLFLAVYCLARGAVDAFFLKPKDRGPTDAQRPRQESSTDSVALPAWESYFHAQCGTDREHLRERVWGARKAIGEKIGRVVTPGWFLLAPIPLLAIVLLVSSWVFLAIFTVVFTVVNLLLYLVGSASWWAVMGVLRLLDWIWRKSRGNEVSCPACYLITARPTHACPACDEVHADVRSGRHGLAYRRCRCMELFPITPTRASWHARGVCTRCGEALARGATGLREVRVALIGDHHAGKTHLLATALGALRRAAGSGSRHFSFADDPSQERVEDVLREIEADRPLDATDGELPQAVSCQMGGILSGTLLHAYDTGAVRFHDHSGHDDMLYLGDAHGLVFVVDPFAVPSLRKELMDAQPARVLLEGHPSHGNPEELYGAVVSRIKAAGHRTKAQRLAVVVSKADLLGRAGVQVPETSTGISSWLYRYGQHNMVTAAEREFAQIRYFAAGGNGQVGGPHDPSLALRWLTGELTRDLNRHSKEVSHS